MPFNDVAQTIVESLVNKFKYPTTGPKAKKYAVMIASIIKAAQTLPKQSEGRKPKYLGVSFGSKNWSRFPLVGREVAVKVVKEVLEYLEANQVAGSGKNWHQDETGKWYLDPQMSMYNINLQRLPSNLLEVTCAPKTPPNLCRVRPTKGRTNEGTIYRRTDHRDDQRAGIW